MAMLTMAYVPVSSADCVVAPMHGQLFVQWVPVSAAVGYRVDYRELYAGDDWMGLYQTTTACGIYIRNLTDGVIYEVRVDAVFADLTTALVGVQTGIPGPPAPSNWLNQILQSGQSLAIGTQGYYALTTSQPYGNVMLNDTRDAFLPLTEPHTRAYRHVEETNASAMANYLSAQQTGFSSAVHIHGWGVSTYLSLKKGTSPYALGMSQMQAAHQLAVASQRASRVTGVTIIHGESDEGEGTTAAAYAADLIEWQHDYETDVRAFTGQDEPVPLFTTQMSSWTGNGHAIPTVALGQLAAARSSTKVHLVTPAYIFEYNDGWHLKAWSYRRLGEYFGKAMKQVSLDGQPFLPLMPLRAARLGTSIEVQFHVPVPPLAFDTTAVMAQDAYGFEVSDDGSAMTVSAVALVSPDTVRLTLGQLPSGNNERLRYAFTGVPGSGYVCGAGAQVVGAPNGNLRDSDPTPALYQDSNVPSWAGNVLRNWCVSFDDPVIPATPLMSWRQQHFNLLMSTGDATDTADPDHDGLRNLAEFALGSDPNLPTADAFSVVNDTSAAIEFIQRAGGTGTIGVDYQAAGVTYGVEVSTDCQHWSSGAEAVAWTGLRQSLGNGCERVRVRATNIPSGSPVFFRLKLTSAE